VLATVTGASLSLLAAPSAVMADDVPDALSVEWQGKKPCEKLFEDAQVRVARCTFPPGAVHACHSHPSSLTYVLSGGKAQVQDEKGTRKVDIAAGAFVDAPPTPWHEFTVVGEYDIPTPESGARCITAMSDGRLFFTQYDAGLIGEIIAG
jgi:quercetin dioxygenase-like cupin family protein